MTVEVKGQGHFTILFFIAQTSFLDGFEMLPNGIFMGFEMFRGHFGHDLDL